jgi:hypothetical protein
VVAMQKTGLPYRLPDAVDSCIGYFDPDYAQGLKIPNLAGAKTVRTLNAPAIVTFKGGKALSFDGIDDKITMEGNVGNKYNYTWAFWVKPVNLMTKMGLIGCDYQRGAIWLNGSSQVQMFATADNSGGYSSGGITITCEPTNGWYFLVGGCYTPNGTLGGYHIFMGIMDNLGKTINGGLGGNIPAPRVPGWWGSATVGTAQVNDGGWTSPDWNGLIGEFYFLDKPIRYHSEMRRLFEISAWKYDR